MIGKNDSIENATIVSTINLLKENQYALFFAQYLAMEYEETNQQLMRLTNHSVMFLTNTNQQLMRLTNH